MLACVSVGLRLYTRIFRLRCAGWDDAIIFAAQVTGTTSAVFLCLSAEYGLGQRSVDVFSSDKVVFFKLFWVANAVFTMSNALVKLSLLAQYLRVFEGRIVRLTCKVLIFLITIWGTIYSFIAWFPCFPPSGFWEFDSSIPCYGYASPNPLHVYQTTVSATASNMAFDILTWALPIHLFADKNLERKTKRALLTLLLLGTVILGIAAGRCIANGATAEAQPDPFKSFSLIVLLGESENRLACILASIPIFWPVIEQAAGRVYRVFITQEFIVGSTRILPGETVVEIGGYETPHWAEERDGSLAEQSGGDDSLGHRDSREKDKFPSLSEMHLPQWPVTDSVEGSRLSSSERSNRGLEGRSGSQ